jgi:SAM-dependent methyltransferase
MTDQIPSSSTVTTQDVSKYWENTPLFSMGIKEVYGEDLFFQEMEKIKLQDDELYTLDYWGFEQWSNKNVLDLGCGPGWFSKMYAQGGAKVTGMDITEKATRTAKRYLELRKLDNGNVVRGDGQKLPFENNSFDLVSSCGVIHHIPDPLLVFHEIKRVLKPQGQARISLYYQNLLIRNRFIFKLMIWILWLFNIQHYDVRSGVDPKNPEEFVRMYDGKANPLGVAKKDSDWRVLLEDAGFEIVGVQVSYFPMRFFEKFFWAKAVKKIHRIIDSQLGFKIHYKLRIHK